MTESTWNFFYVQVQNFADRKIRFCPQSLTVKWVNNNTFNNLLNVCVCVIFSRHSCPEWSAGVLLHYWVCESRHFGNFSCLQKDLWWLKSDLKKKKDQFCVHTAVEKSHPCHIWAKMICAQSTLWLSACFWLISAVSSCKILSLFLRGI